MTALATIADDPVTLDLVLVDTKHSGLLVRRDEQDHDKAVWFRWSEMIEHATTPSRATIKARAALMRERGLCE